MEGPAQAAYKGQIVMPTRPRRHRLLRRHRWLALWGDDNGKAAAGNTWTACTRTSRSTRTPAANLQHGRAGEYVVGISFEYRGNTNKAKGAPIDLVFPKEGLGWDLEAFAIHKAPRSSTPRRSSRLGLEQDAMLLYGKNFAITAQPGVAAPLANVPRTMRPGW